MKKALLTLILSAIVSATFAQWTTSSPNIYYNTGSVGIGTTTPLSLLHITGNVGAADILRLGNVDATDGRTTILFTSSKGPQSWQFGENPGGGAGLFGLRDMTTSGLPIRFVVNTSGYFGIGTVAPVSLLNVSGSGSNANAILDIQSSDAGARGTLIRTGFYGYTSQDNSGNYFQSWGMRLNGADNLWYRAYTAANNYLPYTELTTGGTIVFGGAVSNLTTDANPTLNPVMTVNVGATPSVAIGTTDPKTYMLAVNGSAIATSMTVKLNANWPDYVFKNDYRLPALSEVKAYIDQNHHLPDMPSEQEVADKGLNLGEINKQLTKKVEELTLYLIEKEDRESDQNEKIKQLSEQLQSEKTQLQILEARMEKLESNRK